MHLLPRRAAAVLLRIAAVVALGGCGNPIDAALEGVWTGVDGLTIEFDGNQAVVTDFGSSTLGTNRGVLDIGDAYIEDIACEDSGCEGQIVSPQLVNGTLVSYSRVNVIIEAAGTLITLRSQALPGSTAQFTKAGGGDAGGGGGSTLQQTAACSQWWSAVKAGGPWKVTEVSNGGSSGAPSKTVTLTFSGTDHYTITNPDAVGEAPASGSTGTFGDVIFTDNFSGYCRFAFWSQGQNQVRVWFMRSLSSGRLEVGLDTSAGSPARWVMQGS
ncbi:hypothetical protein FGE12_18515 [Aggregicoccus sp. 17bor-14]|uniref:hypothetical protein n=1 Tax=Myxococcaceae TaxID=31 RepID=UPI00129C6636|nr:MULTISPECIES: hypothetical protein [Myxococcaceae]MBF5044399.1 hypothetical protein [Simulacricoccus sp. 17bor-14]MRI90146.1 hypothetical protein [Aggregicoccus sp. 17bor-14]